MTEIGLGLLALGAGIMGWFIERVGARR